MTRTFKLSLVSTVLCISLLLNLVCIFFVGRRLLLKSATSVYVPPPKPPYYMDRNKLFEIMPPDSNAVVFLGNSLTQYFELAEFFPGIDVKNRGIHGDMMEKVLLRLSPIIASNPKKIFIELGVNDIEQKVPKEKFLAMYDRLIDTLKNACPSTKLYVQSVLPVADTSSYLPYSYCSPQMNKDIVFMNRQLRWLAQRKACTFVDLHDKFLLNNELNPLYSVDGVHLSGQGYALWTKILRPYVEE